MQHASVRAGMRAFLRLTGAIRGAGWCEFDDELQDPKCGPEAEQYAIQAAFAGAQVDLEHKASEDRRVPNKAFGNQPPEVVTGSSTHCGGTNVGRDQGSISENIRAKTPQGQSDNAGLCAVQVGCPTITDPAAEQDERNAGPTGKRKIPKKMSNPWELANVVPIANLRP